MGFRRRFRRGYRRVFGHKSPFRRTFGSRNAGQAIGVSYRQALGPAREIAKMAAEIRGIKQRQNVEKKHKEVVITGSGDEGYYVGQVNQNTDGIVTIDCTPSVTQGIQHDQRVGNSLKLTGMAFKYQLRGMANCHMRQKVRLTLIKYSSADVSAVSHDELTTMMFDVNPLTGVRDTNANLNYATLKQNGIKVLRTHTIYLPDAQHISSSDYQKAHKTGKFSIALQDIIRFIDASATYPEGHRYMLVVQADVGNRDASNDSTKADIPIIESNTGSNLRMHVKYWWVDN